MDETLLDTTRPWKKAETDIFRLLDSDYDRAVALKYKGMSSYDVGRTIARELKATAYTPEQCGERMRRALVEHYHEPITIMPGAEALLRKVSGQFKLAVASGSPLEAIRAALARHKWQDRFAVVVSSDEVPAGKPAPDVFFEAARRLFLEPAACLVIEDSYNGTIAAKRAGMRCFTVPSHKDERIAQVADGVFESLESITIDSIKNLGRELQS